MKAGRQDGVTKALQGQQPGAEQPGNNVETLWLPGAMSNDDNYNKRGCWLNLKI